MELSKSQTQNGKIFWDMDKLKSRQTNQDGGSITVCPENENLAKWPIHTVSRKKKRN